MLQTGEFYICLKFQNCSFSPLVKSVLMPTGLLSLCFPENASSDQTAGADPDYPDSTDPGRGA